MLEYCDLGDAPEFRVQRIGRMELISPNVIRITYLVKVPGGAGEHVAVVHHVWDVADLRLAMDVVRHLAALLDQATQALTAAPSNATAH